MDFYDLGDSRKDGINLPPHRTDAPGKLVTAGVGANAANYSDSADMSATGEAAAVIANVAIVKNLMMEERGRRRGYGLNGLI